MPDTRFAGKTALITGAGSGIGRAVTLRLAREGARVLAVDISADRLAETAGLAEDGVVTEVRDISQRDACFAAVERAVTEFGRLDILGNVAGISRAEHVTQVTEADYRRMMGVNTDAGYFLSQAAIPHLIEAAGSLISIASNAGLEGCAYTVAYCMSKGAVIQMTRALAMEFGRTRMRVNAIAPGAVDTNLMQGFAMPDDIDMSLVKRYFPFREPARPEQIAALFTFLASEEAEGIHGAILSHDAGMTAG